jgi:glycosyltransferase involved in cell wall biosynthesis
LIEPLTVAVPIFNGARFLGRTLESLLAQTYRHFTLLCIDDDSTDDSVRISQSFKDARVSVIHNAARRGLGGNWNTALSSSQTPYLAIAHQDDVYEPRFLEETLDVLERHPRAFMAHTRATYVDEEERPDSSAALRFKDAFWPDAEPYEREPRQELATLQKGNYIICPSVVFRMSAVAKIGPFNESYRFVADWEYWMRGLLAGYTIAGTHQRLIRWRRHSGTATRSEEATLRRYDEELTLLDWLSAASGLPRRLEAVENTLLSEFATRVASGDRTGAAALQTYARTHLPESRRMSAVMHIGMLGGSPAGRALKLAERIYTVFARRR